jgi:hypothetical protein
MRSYRRALAVALLLGSLTQIAASAAPRSPSDGSSFFGRMKAAIVRIVHALDAADPVPPKP